jgi:hypothetical protein
MDKGITRIISHIEREEREGGERGYLELLSGITPPELVRLASTAHNAE